MGQSGQPLAAGRKAAASAEQEERDAVFEVERFEWASPERIELAGVWSGLRGRRFIRPTLMLRREGEEKRLLASLEHKPWELGEDGRWLAAFAWEGEPEKFDSAELHVGAGIELELPRPRMRPGKPSSRFRHRAVAREATRDAAGSSAAAAAGGGIVSDPPTDAAAPGAKPDPPTDAPAPRAKPDPGASLAATLQRVRKERDEALEQARRARAELEQERQAREAAIAAARAEEREAAGRTISEGAQLRAAVERQREMAFLERDDALAERDSALAAQAQAEQEKKDAVAARKDAQRERDHAVAERDRASSARERAERARAEAEAERDEMRAERDSASRERDTVVDLHERGLPLREPRPKYWPRENRTATEVWAPRAIAAGLLVLFALIVVRLFAGV